MTKQIKHFLGIACLILCFALLGTACGGETAMQEPETTAPTETGFQWPANTLVSDSVTFSDGKRYEWGETAAGYPVLGSELLRGQVRV